MKICSMLAAAAPLAVLAVPALAVDITATRNGYAWTVIDRGDEFSPESYEGGENLTFLIWDTTTVTPSGDNTSCYLQTCDLEWCPNKIKWREEDQLGLGPGQTTFVVLRPGDKFLLSYLIPGTTDKKWNVGEFRVPGGMRLAYQAWPVDPLDPEHPTELKFRMFDRRLSPADVIYLHWVLPDQWYHWWFDYNLATKILTHIDLTTGTDVIWTGLCAPGDSSHIQTWGDEDSRTPECSKIDMHVDESYVYDGWISRLVMVSIVNPPRDQKCIQPLDDIAVTFNGAVTGVTPDDMTVDGSAATAVAGSGAGPYTFSGFADPGLGIATVVLAAGGIQSDPGGSPFAGDTWTHEVIVQPDICDFDWDGDVDDADYQKLKECYSGPYGGTYCGGCYPPCSRCDVDGDVDVDLVDYATFQGHYGL